MAKRRHRTAYQKATAGLEMCEPYDGHGNGMRKWLESEAEEDNG